MVPNLVENPFLKHFKVNYVVPIAISAYGWIMMNVSGNRIAAFFSLVFMALWIPGAALGADSLTKTNISVKTPAQATPTPVLETATVGIYIMNIRDMSPARGTFSCDFWIWAKTTTQENILADLQFLNAEKVIWYTETKPEIAGMTGYKRRGTGTFRMNWNLKHYPYDSQVLPIQMEYSLRDSTKIILKPDTINSGINRENIPPDWSVKEFVLRPETSTYTSNLGDPTIGEAKGSFSLRLTAHAQAGVGILEPRLDRLCGGCDDACQLLHRSAHPESPDTSRSRPLREHHQHAIGFLGPGNIRHVGRPVPSDGRWIHRSLPCGHCLVDCLASSWGRPQETTSLEHDDRYRRGDPLRPLQPLAGSESLET